MYGCGFKYNIAQNDCLQIMFALCQRLSSTDEISRKMAKTRIRQAKIASELLEFLEVIIQRPEWNVVRWCVNPYSSSTLNEAVAP